MNELVIKKCVKCNAIIKAIRDCSCGEECGIKCCDEKMVTLKANTTDAVVEKHIPIYEIVGEELLVKVNHVMEDEHHIEWITMITDNAEYVINLKPGQVAETRFPYVSGAKLYEYCNKHGLWSKEVK